MSKSLSQDIIDGGKTIPYKKIKEHPEDEKEFIRKNKKGHQFPTIQKYACGEYTVRSVLSMYGKDYINVDIADEDGVEMPEIIKRLNKSGIGLRIKEKATYEDIKPKAIVYYPKEDHWAAVENLNAKKIIIHDSNYKEERGYSRETFESKWLDKNSGYVANTFKQEKNIL